VKKLVDEKRQVLGLPIDSLLTDLGWTCVQEYLAGMEPQLKIVVSREALWKQRSWATSGRSK